MLLSAFVSTLLTYTTMSLYWEHKLAASSLTHVVGKTVLSRVDCDLSITGEFTMLKLDRIVEEQHLRYMRHCDVRTVTLHSPGGYTITGLYLGLLFRQWGVHTVVVDYCNSACVIAFLGGIHRTVGAEGVMIAHGPRLGVDECVDDSDDIVALLWWYSLEMAVPPPVSRAIVGDCRTPIPVDKYLR